MSRTALYRQRDAAGYLLYVGVSCSPADRMHQHASQSHWAGEIATVSVEYFPTRDEALAAERSAIACERPRHNTAWNVSDDKAEVNTIVATLTADAMCAALGVGRHAVRYARFTGTFPGNWYGTLLPMCMAAGIECPLTAFTWKTPKSTPTEQEPAA